MKTNRPVPTRKSRARAIFKRRVCRQTFLKRVTDELDVTEGTARVWWQQFRTHSTLAARPS